MTDHRHDFRRCVACDQVLGETLPSEERIEVIRSYARSHPRIRTFVETGTADGSTPAALLYEFDHLFTIELDPNVANNAVNRFRECGKVTALCGESAQVIADLVHNGMLPGPVLWWLDAHWCGGVRGEKATPIMDELDAIFLGQYADEDVILIDDVRLFGFEPGWPDLDEVLAMLHARGFQTHVTQDILRAIRA